MHTTEKEGGDCTPALIAPAHDAWHEHPEKEISAAGGFCLDFIFTPPAAHQTQEILLFGQLVRPCEWHTRNYLNSKHIVLEP